MAKQSAADKVIAELEAERQIYLDAAARATDSAQTITAVIQRVRSAAKPTKPKAVRKAKPAGEGSGA